MAPLLRPPRLPQWARAVANALRIVFATSILIFLAIILLRAASTRLLSVIDFAGYTTARTRCQSRDAVLDHTGSPCGTYSVSSLVNEDSLYDQRVLNRLRISAAKDCPDPSDPARCPPLILVFSTFCSPLLELYAATAKRAGLSFAIVNGKWGGFGHRHSPPDALSSSRMLSMSRYFHSPTVTLSGSCPATTSPELLLLGLDMLHPPNVGGCLGVPTWPEHHLSYLNAGLSVGPAWAHTALIESTYTSDCDDDQRVATRAFLFNLTLAHPGPAASRTPAIALDHWAHLFQSLGGETLDAFELDRPDDPTPLLATIDPNSGALTLSSWPLAAGGITAGRPPYLRHPLSSRAPPPPLRNALTGGSAPCFLHQNGDKSSRTLAQLLRALAVVDLDKHDARDPRLLRKKIQDTFDPDPDDRGDDPRKPLRPLPFRQHPLWAAARWHSHRWRAALMEFCLARHGGAAGRSQQQQDPKQQQYRPCTPLSGWAAATILAVEVAGVVAAIVLVATASVRRFLRRRPRVFLVD
ncbi:hypothetical protein HK405_005996 [Cladochytrium tenue]|nr:hypothetical protein HK405_005996 [Cladochytrium tenue]